ncbi:MAG TPA: indole-3-glycerol-phosphate synthase, partial [Candidatus Nitrosopelagicus sp.]|nr:indole-3-glycerol-phosphate synthase [Candidatus Nitrosopelagicus sp.]
MKNVLEKLVMNSRKAIDEGCYNITKTLPKSKIDLKKSIRDNKHASLITEIK